MGEVTARGPGGMAGGVACRVAGGTEPIGRGELVLGLTPLKDTLREEEMRAMWQELHGKA